MLAKDDPCLQSISFDCTNLLNSFGSVSQMKSYRMWTTGEDLWKRSKNSSNTEITLLKNSNNTHLTAFSFVPSIEYPLLKLMLFGIFLGSFANSHIKWYIASHCSRILLIAGPILNQQTSVCCWKLWVFKFISTSTPLKSSHLAALYLKRVWRSKQSWSTSFPYYSIPLLNALWTVWIVQVPRSTKPGKFECLL